MTTQVATKSAHQSREDVQDLVASAAAGLVQMFDEERQLFCAKMIRTERGLAREGISHRYTLITLMGLHRLELAGQTAPIAIAPSFDALLRDSVWINNVGDLGLLLWLCALVAPERIAEFFSRHDLESALEKFADARERRTMELSWVLSGLAHATHAQPKLRDKLNPLASKLYATIHENRGAWAVFGHQAETGGIAGRFRGRLGSFADQVYPIYAFAWASRAFGFGETLKTSAACADAICRAQGPLGQWWWHYDAKSGNAVGRFPVYSVHQHGMAPLALYALTDAGGKDFSREIFLGLDWIYGRNELRQDLRDAATQVVWRCIRPAKSRRYLDQALSMLKVHPSRYSTRDLHVLHECWPYELGWLLYAFAGRDIA
jgi:hypothetical protein